MHRHGAVPKVKRVRPAIRTIGFIDGPSAFLGEQSAQVVVVLGQAHELGLGTFGRETIAHDDRSAITVLLGDEEGGGLCHLSGESRVSVGWVRLPSLSEDMAKIHTEINPPNKYANIFLSYAKK